MMSAAERNFVIRQLDQSRKRLVLILAGLTEDQLLYRPRRERWSIAEIVEHLVTVEERVLAAVEKLLAQPPDVIKQSSMGDAEVVWRLTSVVDPIRAPEQVVPNMRCPPETLPERFEIARRNTREFVSTTAGDLRRHFIHHFVFGDLDCYQWLLLLGSNCNRHCAQAEMVSFSPGFPRLTTDNHSRKWR